MARKGGKGGKGDDANVYQKWQALGYLDGLSEADGTKLALMMEAAKVDFSKQAQYSTPISIRTTNGRINFEMSDVIYNSMRQAFDEKQDPDNTKFNHDLIWSEAVSSVTLLAEDFYGGDGIDMFDSTKHLAFAAKFGAQFSKDNLKPGGR